MPLLLRAKCELILSIPQDFNFEITDNEGILIFFSASNGMTELRCNAIWGKSAGHHLYTVGIFDLLTGKNLFQIWCNPRAKSDQHKINRKNLIHTMATVKGHFILQPLTGQVNFLHCTHYIWYIWFQTNYHIANYVSE